MGLMGLQHKYSPDRLEINCEKIEEILNLYFYKTTENIWSSLDFCNNSNWEIERLWSNSGWYKCQKMSGILGFYFQFDIPPLEGGRCVRWAQCHNINHRPSGRGGSDINQDLTRPLLSEDLSIRPEYQLLSSIVQNLRIVKLSSFFLKNNSQTWGGCRITNGTVNWII